MEPYVEVEKVSWFKKIKNAIAGLIFAPLFIFVGFMALKYGEINHAKTTSALKIVINNIKDSGTVKNGNLFRYVDTVYSPKMMLLDKEFGLKIKAIKLYRKVYTYQWIEKKDTKEERTLLGGTRKETTYTYEKGWRRFIINSKRFKHKEGHENPEVKKYDSLLIEQDEIKIGKFRLDKEFRNYMLNFKLLDLRPEMFTLKMNGVLDTTNRAECPWQEIYNSCSKSSSGRSDIKTSSIFFGKGNPLKPEIGDTRVEYWYIPEDLYTIIGKKWDDTIKPEINDSLFIQSELPYGGTIHSPLGNFGMIFQGNKSVDEMFKDVHKENDIIFVILRFVGLMFMVGGFALFGNTLRILFGWIPFIGAVWEKAVFKLMQVIGTFVSICISVYYFMTYNRISNLTIYDFYFGVAVILFILLIHNLKTSVSSNGQEIHSEQF